MRMEHANITVRNIDRSVDFYHQLFGFNTRWSGTANGSEGPVRAVHIGSEDTYLSLFEADSEGEVASAYGRPGFNHLGFEVADLGPYRNALAALGVRVHLEQDYEPGERIYFFDPDGVEVELVCYGQTS